VRFPTVAVVVAVIAREDDGVDEGKVDLELDRVDVDVDEDGRPTGKVEAEAEALALASSRF
jgi:hypothetical protein